MPSFAEDLEALSREVELRNAARERGAVLAIRENPDEDSRLVVHFREEVLTLHGQPVGVRFILDDENGDEVLRFSVGHGDLTQAWADAPRSEDGDLIRAALTGRTAEPATDRLRRPNGSRRRNFPKRQDCEFEQLIRPA